MTRVVFYSNVGGQMESLRKILGSNDGIAPIMGMVLAMLSMASIYNILQMARVQNRSVIGTGGSSALAHEMSWAMYNLLNTNCMGVIPPNTRFNSTVTLNGFLAVGDIVNNSLRVQNIRLVSLENSNNLGTEAYVAGRIELEFRTLQTNQPIYRTFGLTAWVNNDDPDGPGPLLPTIQRCGGQDTNLAACHHWNKVARSSLDQTDPNFNGILPIPAGIASHFPLSEDPAVGANRICNQTNVGHLIAYEMCNETYQVSVNPGPPNLTVFNICMEIGAI